MCKTLLHSSDTIELLLEDIVRYLRQTLGVETSKYDCDIEVLERALAHGVVKRLQVEQIAQICCLSLSTFKRRCIDYYGLPPHRLIINYRMALAIRLLTTTRLPLSEVAQRCGYATVSHFIATFRRHYGTTPSCYRRRCVSK